MPTTLLAGVLLVALSAAPADDVLRSSPQEVDGVAPGKMMHAYLMQRAYEAFDDEFLTSIGLAKDIESFLAATQFVQSMPDPEILALRWEELKAGF